MGKIILAREEDRGTNRKTVSAMFVFSLMIGFIGIPIGAVLSMVMQEFYKGSLEIAVVKYVFFLAPIFLGIIIGFFISKKVVGKKDHTKCEMCKGRMKSLSEEDLLFKIPAVGEKYDDALNYLAGNMKKISEMSSIEGRQRGCYVCVYKCERCANKIVRIKDFMPVHGCCNDMGTYYFGYTEFINARKDNDFEC